ncbi:MAG: tyrosine-type recombinase/integrase [Candidatus Moraniibacteriota bacterium]|nr:tyrosine-type recombinase/integrase [Candidatus Moranbacteria bacterium]HRZ34144.1 tyrosine-type recombinase/integrase [Candidatus Moranbacteria bacterium]
MDHIKDYLDYLKLERCLSEHTVRVYKNNLHEFRDYLGKSGSIRATKRKDIRAFLFSLANQPITKRLKQTTLRNFFRFLEDENIIRDNPMKNLPMPKVISREPSYLSELEVRKLIGAVEKDESKFQPRNEVAVRILAETGFRLSELTNISLNDINLENKTIRIRRKGNVEQVVPINKRLAKLLKVFMKGKKPNEPLIKSSLGKRMTARRVSLMLQKYLEKAGVARKGISVHSLRHSYCVRLLEKGASLRATQILLGHKSIATTERYMHLTKNQLAKEVKLSQID